MSKQTNLSLSVAGVTIRQKEQLYCLNDLHKASGGERRHEIANWMTLKSTQEEIEYLTNNTGTLNLSYWDSSSLIIRTVLGKGKEQGTYVCKDLVYSYAMWVSAAFKFAVIRAYDALVNDVNNRAALAGEYRPMTDTLSGLTPNLHYLKRRMSSWLKTLWC